MAAAGPNLAGGLEGDCSAARALTVVVPTFNERENISVLIDRVARALGEVAWQVIVVDDDSPDGTAAVVKAIAATDERVSCLRRIGRRGLAGAVVEGIMAASAPFVAVIDADLQHDETLLPAMLEHVRAGRADLVIGSRYLRPGAVALGLSPMRRFGSHLAAWLARRVLETNVSDPVSGFFMVRRSVVETVAPRLSSHGFKILFDIIASHPAPLRILELPYAFAQRQAGQSKFDGRVVVDYLALLMARLTGDLIPPRAVMFGLVGASGLIVHLAVLRLCHGLGARFAAAQLIAALTAMTSNYLINNAVTYRDRRLAGAALFIGYLRFAALCAIGLIANVAVADLVHRWTPAWWLAGAAGALFGAAWNYVSTSLAVW
ncbi:MAG: glycosyltransferase family 2 protein [Pseudomonadota bacterium]